MYTRELNVKIENEITRRLEWFIGEMNEPDKYYMYVGSDAYYKWGIVYEYDTNNMVFRFRGRTYDELMTNIELAWSAYHTAKRGF